MALLRGYESNTRGISQNAVRSPKKVGLSFCREAPFGFQGKASESGHVAQPPILKQIRASGIDNGALEMCVHPSGLPSLGIPYCNPFSTLLGDSARCPSSHQHGACRRVPGRSVVFVFVPVRCHGHVAERVHWADPFGGQEIRGCPSLRVFPVIIHCLLSSPSSFC